MKCNFYSKCIPTADRRALCVCPYCAENDYNPVCGNDGMSYASYCWMKSASCLKQKMITSVKDKVCGEIFYVYY